MYILADLQLHSRFSRAVSREMTIPNIAQWATRKGIDLIATGDWTHPIWFRDIESNLVELGNGLLKLNQNGIEKSQIPNLNAQLNPKSNIQKEKNTTPLFLLATEVSCIYKQGEKVRRIHTLIWVPTLDSARKINQEMTRRGCNLMSDGRPIIGLTSIDLTELVLSIEPQALVIPAHAWTPWFSVYGALGGFDSIDEAFGKYAEHIYAVETGLSSNPSMNWRIKELDNRSILSFSDAHSGPKLGREATVFDLNELSYRAIYEAISQSSVFSSRFSGSSLSVVGQPVYKKSNTDQQKTDKYLSDNRQPKNNPPRRQAGNSIAYTIEFYPEEGKYHYTGHRACNIRQTPEETKKKGNTCPVCGKPLTVGVMHRIEDLAGRSESDLKIRDVEIPGLVMKGIGSEKFPNRPPFVMLVPLQEILSEAVGSPVTSPKVQTPYFRLTDQFGSEFDILLKSPVDELRSISGDRVAEAIGKVRTQDIMIDPGYDGVFGVVKIWSEDEEKPLIDASKEQLSIF